MRIEYSSEIIQETLGVLRDAGTMGHECVVLWLGRRGGDHVSVQEVYRPRHEARRDMFWITQEGMHELKDRLRSARTMVAAQVHTHPEAAFHSPADDRWAIVRHEGALSLVLPRFALQSTAETFMTDVRIYRLSRSDRWCEVLPEDAQEYLCPS